MGQSFIDVLARKIEERQLLENRPMGTLAPRLHPAEIMELQLLARSAPLHLRVAKKPYGARSTKAASGKPQALLEAQVSNTIEAKTETQTPYSPEPRPAAKIPMGIREVLARELFVKWGASLEQSPLKKEINKAYRKLAFKLHPDRSSAPDAGVAFADLTAAYQILKTWADKAY